MIYFTADTHFKHTNVIKYCNRPFPNANKMDNCLINNWNTTVKKDDIVYILGDFTMNKQEEILESIISKLNGEKHLILGNHDNAKPFAYINAGFTSVHTSLKLDDYENVYMHHDPTAANFLKEGDLLLHGHIHNLWKLKKSDTGIMLFNVGVDVHDFKPISLEEIEKLIREYEDNLSTNKCEKLDKLD